MARTRRSAKLDTHNARRQLEAERRHMMTISVGHHLIYRRPKNGAAGSWQACFINPSNRKQTREVIGIADDFEEPNGTTILSFHQANAAATAWFREQERRANIVEDGVDMPKGPFTVADALKAYFRDAEIRGMKTVRHCKGRAANWILPTFGTTQVSKLTRAKIESWLGEIAQAPKKRRTGPMSTDNECALPQTDDQKRARKDTANRVLSILKASLTYCVDRNLADSPDRPWQLVKPFRGVAKARIRFLTVEEQVRLVEACDPEFRQLVRGALLTGCRYGELTRLTCKDYDPTSGSVFVAESKSGKPRHVYLTEEGKLLFGELTKDADPGRPIFVRHSARREKKDPRPHGWQASDQCQMMRRACTKAGIETVTFHELRHTYASTLVNKGASLSVVAKLLGHAGTEMLEKHYAHLAENTVRDELIKAMPRLGILDRP